MIVKFISLVARSRRGPAHPAATLNVGNGRNYPGGYPDPEVEDFAIEDGNAAVHNPAIFGENTAPRVIEIINHAHDTDAGLIAHDYRGCVQPVAEKLEIALPEAKSAEQDVLDGLERERQTREKRIRLRHKIEADGLHVLHTFAFAWLVLAMAGLFFGDLPIISLGFQVLGLSDKPIIPGVAFSDELHLAALASVTALLILAHIAGHKLRLVVHDLERRRKATTDEVKLELPRPSRMAMGIGVGCVLSALFLLDGVSAIRVDYLRQRGIAAQSAAFIAIQIGVLSAALLLSYLHAHPYKREWADITREDKKVTAQARAKEQTHVSLVGKVNGLIDLLDTVEAQAGHHVGVSASDARRQGQLYPRRVTLSQPEPTIERLFPETLPEPTVRVSEDLAKFLIGVAPLPKFERLDTSAVLKQREEIRVELRILENELTTGTAQPVDDESAELQETTSDEDTPDVAEELDREFANLSSSNGHDPNTVAQ
jgi:hypothetical protein